MSKMGRPPDAENKIDLAELKDLMKFCPSRKEVSDWFDVSDSTITRFIDKYLGCTFDELRDKSFVRTKIALKRAQIKKALSGDNTMMIWMGKQLLGQRDKFPEEEEAVAKEERSPGITKDQAIALLEAIKGKADAIKKG